MNRLLRNLTLGVVCSGLGLWLACDSATPTAPSGTVLTITANPSQIGLSGSSRIIVIGRRPDGNPLNPGTEIFFSTSRGTIAPTVTTVDDAGVATAVLRGDGRAGSATVTASVSTTSGGGGGGGEGGEGGGPTTGIGSASTTVLIGNDPEDRPTLLVSASPSTIFVNESSEITVIARNSDGSPFMAGEQVILTSTLGTLTPSRPRVGNDGTATATLRAGAQPGTAEVTAIVGSSDPATTSVTIQDTASDIDVIPDPSTIPQQGGTIDVNAFVINSQGEPVPGRQVTFSAQVGQYLQGAVAFTDQQGQATATLTVTEQQLGNRASFTVSATTASGGGNFIDDDAVVNVQGR